MLTRWLRWIAVMPGAIIVGVLLTIPLRFVLYNTLTSFIEPYPELPERILTPFVVAGGFIWSGSKIAPTRKMEVAVTLFGIWMMGLGAALAVVFFNVEIRGRDMLMHTGGMGPAMAIAGGLAGLLLVRADLSRSATEAIR